MHLRNCFLFFAILACFLAASCTSQPDPNDPAVQAAISEAQNLGLAYLEENQLQEAEDAFRELIRLNPDDPAGYANLGITYLRNGAYDQAEEYLLAAMERAPNDPDIPISLATVYEQTERLDQARTFIESALERNPEHVQTLFTRAQLYKDDIALVSTYADHLELVVQFAPANIVPRFYLIESLTQADEYDRALQQLIDLQQQLPDIPREALPHFDMAVSALQARESVDAFRSVRIFHNLMKVTPYYQTSLRLLGLRTDAAVGTPIISEPTGLTQTAFSQGDGSVDIIDAVQLTNATANSGLHILSELDAELTSSVLLDIDGDKETDLFVTAWDPDQQSSTVYLLRNQFGRFSDITQSSGLNGSSARPLITLAADFDNDTFLDLFILNEGPDQVFKNNGDGTFQDISNQTNIAVPDAQDAIFADVDHDGDLDLLIGRDGPNLLYRNNLDGSFTEIAAETGLSGLPDNNVKDIDFGDFDDDGDLDLLLSTSQGLRLLSNSRQGVFEAVPGLFQSTTGEASASAVGDFNNDGFLDIFVTASEGPTIYTNLGNNQFSESSNALSLVEEASSQAVTDALFFDVDNDGFLDLLVSGDAPRLLHNNREGAFTDITSQIFPELPATTLHAGFTDYNLDRDLDLFLQSPSQIQLFRNDGGQANRMISIQTRGLVNNNSKNNYYSIGAKVELRAGDLYQTRVVTEPVTYFGLGKRVKADVIRIVFTNGVPQNIFRPGTDQDIIEQQILKGSCPFLYTWNGTGYQFATDLLWRSALGMPLGIMAEGSTAYAPASLAEDYIMIPEGMLVPEDGVYKIKITGELWETPFIDEVKLMTVDAPSSYEIRIDEKFGPPPPTPLPIYTHANQTSVLARSDSGEDITAFLATEDHTYTHPPHTTRFQGLTELHGITLTPTQALNPDNAVLYLKGWIFPTDASINVAMSQSDAYKSTPPRVQVRNQSGDWETVIPNMGFPMGKNKTVRVDLSGKFLTDDYSVRIVTNMQLYWDHAFFTEETASQSTRKTVLSPQTADLQYRGFSRMYKSSPFGPHLFDHDSVSTDPKWIDLEGLYTRYGDVTPLLNETNDQYVIMNAGDAMTISFNADQAPPLPEGWKRHFILYTNGWLKDGDLNTAHGKTVEPLPFEGMSAYPYASNQGYPLNTSNLAYLEQYNTRVVTNERFRDWLKPAD